MKDTSHHPQNLAQIARGLTYVHERGLVHRPETGEYFLN